MPFRDDDPRKQCYDRAIALRNLFRTYSDSKDNSRFARLTDRQIEKNVIDRYHLYEKAQEYVKAEKISAAAKNELIGDRDGHYMPRINSIYFPLNNNERAADYVEAFNKDNIKNKYVMTKKLLDDILNVDVGNAFGSFENANKFLDNAIKNKELYQPAWAIKDFVEVLEHQNELQLPEHYLQAARDSMALYQGLNDFHYIAKSTASDFNFLISGKDNLTVFTQDEVFEIKSLYANVEDAERERGTVILDEKLQLAKMDVAGCYKEEVEENIKIGKNLKKLGMTGRICDYKTRIQNGNRNLYHTILECDKRNIVKRSNAEIENGVGFDSGYYKSLWNRTRCAKFNNFANEVNNTNEHNQENVETQLKRFAILSKINKEHKNDLSGWDYINPVGWHKRSRYKKEKECLDNFRHALENKGYPKNLLDKIEERGNISCVTTKMLSDLTGRLNNRVAHPNLRPQAFDLKSYVSPHVENTIGRCIEDAENPIENNIQNLNNNAINANEQVNANQNNIQNNINNINNLNNAQNNNNPVIGNMNVQNNNENIIEINTNMNQQNNNNNIINTNSNNDNAMNEQQNGQNNFDEQLNENRKEKIVEKVNKLKQQKKLKEKQKKSEMKNTSSQKGKKSNNKNKIIIDEANDSGSMVQKVNKFKQQKKLKEKQKKSEMNNDSFSNWE